ncbi:hypothetical protein Xen7305DRAFT_00040340 [Xenococcus sp. PCC 7305]|nr:hypothetical protein Xen7305DRAFT_00040340 [Xenococcus sp. PCC 7305]
MNGTDTPIYVKRKKEQYCESKFLNVVYELQFLIGDVTIFVP